MGWKCRHRLCQNFKFRFWKNFGCSNFEIGTSKPEIWSRCWILVPKFHFQKSKIGFFNSSRISYRDPKIKIQLPKLPPDLLFRAKIQTVLRPKSWFCIRCGAAPRSPLLSLSPTILFFVRIHLLQLEPNWRQCRLFTINVGICFAKLFSAVSIISILFSKTKQAFTVCLSTPMSPTRSTTRLFMTSAVATSTSSGN